VCEPSEQFEQLCSNNLVQSLENKEINSVPGHHFFPPVFPA
jgi:hypothetical protein